MKTIKPRGELYLQPFKLRLAKRMHVNDSMMVINKLQQVQQEYQTLYKSLNENVGKIIDLKHIGRTFGDTNIHEKNKNKKALSCVFTADMERDHLS